MGGRTVGLLWGLTRLLTEAMLLVVAHERVMVRDVGYFGHSLAHLSSVGLAHTLVEYPLPAVGIVAVPWVLARALGSTALYVPLFIAGTMLVDGAFTAMLHRRREKGRNPALVMWLLAGPVLGGITLVRFDLVPGVLVAVALLTVAQRPRLASAALAFAAAVKLWPLVLVPALTSAVRTRGVVLRTVAVVGLLLAGVSVVAAGWSRLFSPLTYQSHRGLQIESVPATPVMVAWLLDPGRWTVSFASSKSYEVAGPGVPLLLRASTLLTVALVGGLGVLWWRALRRSSPVTPRGLVWLCLASLTGLLVSAKVLSPQYLLWLLPVAAAGLVLAADRTLRLWCGALLLLAALTHAVYPWLYHGLLANGGASLPATTLLAARNLLLVLLLASAVRVAWQELAEPRGTREHPHRNTVLVRRSRS